MLTQSDRQTVAEFTRRLKRTISVRDVRVFGSRARGNAAPDSGLDVFVVLESCTPELRQRINDIAWEVGFEDDKIISPLVATVDQLERGPFSASPLLLAIEQEGVRL
ncbi:MAG TPA: nucleotidyltransferase domain-containing protein [Chloroflexi bacterium]|nr:MAG: hypothetical protein B6243_04820 [Anaerolineaceae bacterium 4572_5.2]HEY84607.1 nucleotidyltransferase domain-containing protein [Chloroflexota bacterium]